MLEQYERKRADNPDRVVLWAAQRFVRPYQEKLETWLRESARLAAMLALHRGEADRAKIAALRVLVSHTLTEFELAEREVSEEVRRHSVVRDIKRAIIRLAESLSGLS